MARALRAAEIQDCEGTGDTRFPFEKPLKGGAAGPQDRPGSGRPRRKCGKVSRKSWRGFVFSFLGFFFLSFFFQARRAGDGGPFVVPQCHLMAEETRRRGYGKKIPQVRCFSGGKKRTGGASGRHADDCDSHEKQRPTGETPASRHRYPTRGFLSSALETIATAPEVLPRRTKATDCWARDGMGWDWWAVLTCALPPCEVRASLRARGRWKFPRGTCCKLSVERRDLRGPGRMPTDMPRHQRTLGRSSRPLLAFPSLITSSPCPGRPAPPSLQCLQYTAISLLGALGVGPHSLPHLPLDHRGRFYPGL